LLSKIVEEGESVDIVDEMKQLFIVSVIVEGNDRDAVV
jgi:hypothetical protein